MREANNTASESGTIRWRLHLRSAPERVYEMLASDAGRARFWAESALEEEGIIDFAFPNSERWRGRILEARPPHRFALEYIGGSVVAFELADDGRGGTDLTLLDRGVAPEEREEVRAGWVSVLLTLKAAVDFGVDLRNHDPERNWSTGHVDN
jgi:uncharacterized protein YndB with AHSA1/START domain